MMVKLFVCVSNNLKLIEQIYIEILCLLEPNKQDNRYEEELKLMNLENKLISAKSSGDLCLPILDICVEFLIQTILNELLRVVIKISNANPITIQLTNDLKILVHLTMKIDLIIHKILFRALN